MLSSSADRAARSAQVARLTRAEADTLADALAILSTVADAASSAGWRSSDSMSAMRFGKVSEAAGVACSAVTHYLIVASVNVDDSEAGYAVDRDDPDDGDAVVEVGS